MIRVEHWTKEQQESWKKDHPLAEPKPWVLLDDDIVEEFCDTEKDAYIAMGRLMVED